MTEIALEKLIIGFASGAILIVVFYIFRKAGWFSISKPTKKETGIRIKNPEKQYIPKLLLYPLFLFMMLLIFYLFMVIINMKLDLSFAGYQEVKTENYSKCLADYKIRNPIKDTKHIPLYSNEWLRIEGYEHCDSIIAESERYQKVFRLPKVYFLPPR